MIWRAVCLCFFAFASWAVQPDEVLSDPVAEERARALSRELRCTQCSGESVDDSSAPQSRTIRLLVRERIVAGDSNQDIKDYLVERFGPDILFEPPKSGVTLLLWLSPILLLLFAAYIITMKPKKHQQQDDENERLAALLESTEEKNEL